MVGDRLASAIAAAQRVLATQPSALCSDIDGTLSPIVQVPEAAFVPEPIKQALAALAERLALVVAITGRGVEDARRMVGLDQFAYVGNHGLERWRNGRVDVHPRAERYVPLIAATLRQLSSDVDVPGVIFEDKGASASIHYRLAADPAATRALLLGAIAGGAHASELRVVEGRMVLNLLPNLRLDKGRAIEALVDEHRLNGVVFLGDDVTDLDGFRALAALRDSRGLATLSVAVASPEAPAELTAAADVAVEGVAGVASLLEALAADPFGE